MSRFQPSSYSARANQGEVPQLSKAGQTGQAIGAALPGVVQATGGIINAVRGRRGGKKAPPPPPPPPPEEEGSVWPWLLGGVVVLGLAGGGLYLATRPTTTHVAG